MLSLTGTNDAVLGRVNEEMGAREGGRGGGMMMMLAVDVELCECGSGNMVMGNDGERADGEGRYMNGQQPGN